MVWTAEPCLTAAAAAGRSTAKHMQGGRAPADESGSSKQRSVFVTVGTTKFDSLIREVCAAGCQDELLARGYTELLVQKGKGSFSPPQAKAVPGSSLGVTVFDFAPSLATYMRSASLVISHAGSGSIFEALRAGKPLVVVINEALMDNHQQELAHALEKQQHLFCATPETLQAILSEMDVSTLKPYPEHEAYKYAEHLDKFLGLL